MENGDKDLAHALIRHYGEAAAESIARQYAERSATFLDNAGVAKWNAVAVFLEDLAKRKLQFQLSMSDPQKR